MIALEPKQKLIIIGVIVVIVVGAGYLLLSRKDPAATRVEQAGQNTTAASSQVPLDSAFSLASTSGLNNDQAAAAKNGFVKYAATTGISVNEITVAKKTIRLLPFTKENPASIGFTVTIGQSTYNAVIVQITTYRAQLLLLDSNGSQVFDSGIINGHEL